MDLISRRIAATGLELAINERGVGHSPTIVLVHGFPDTSDVWNPVAEGLATRFHVVTYDVRGAGLSDVPTTKEQYGLDYLVRDLLYVLDATSPGEPVHLVGHDWGSIQCWEAVCDDRLSGRLLSYTSISGPPLDHAGRWFRARLRPHPKALHQLFRQGVRSWYITAFNTPGVIEVARFSRRFGPFNRRLWTRMLSRGEGITATSDWPAASFSSDLAQGINLYRANVPSRLRRPGTLHTDLPVQVIAPTKDPYVTPALLDGLEAIAPQLWRRNVPLGHWVPRSSPDSLAKWVSEFADFASGGTESRSLRRLRVVAQGDATTTRSTQLVVVTGAGSGIGRATALAFAKTGASLVVADIDPESAKETAVLCEAVNVDAHPFAVDVSDAAAMEAFTASVERELGVPDIVVNNAGIAIAGPFLKTGVADWEHILGVNLWGVLHGSRLFAQMMVDEGVEGHIVNVASAAAFMPSRNYPAYATTKAAVLMLSECLRSELGDNGIGVSAICPGFANTGIATATRYVGVSGEEQDHLRASADKAYKRRNLSPETIAKAILRAVDKNSAVTLIGAEAHGIRFLSRAAPRVIRRLAKVSTPESRGQ